MRSVRTGGGAFWRRAEASRPVPGRLQADSRCSRAAGPSRCHLWGRLCALCFVLLWGWGGVGLLLLGRNRGLPAFPSGDGMRRGASSRLFTPSLYLRVFLSGVCPRFGCAELGLCSALGSQNGLGCKGAQCSSSSNPRCVQGRRPAAQAAQSHIQNLAVTPAVLSVGSRNSAGFPAPRSQGCPSVSSYPSPPVSL